MAKQATHAWGLYKDAGTENAFSFYALTLGQLYAIQRALRYDEHRTAVGNDVLIQVDRAIESAELAYR